MYRDVALIEEPIPVHLAQALCYASIYARQQDLPRIGIQNDLMRQPEETGELRYFRSVREREELEQWFDGLLCRYEKWARFQYEWKRTRKASIQPLEFPFVYREGQRELAAGVYRTIARGKRLFIQAPTGVGKDHFHGIPGGEGRGGGAGRPHLLSDSQDCDADRG